MRHRPRSSRPRRGIGSVWSLFVSDLPSIDGRRLRSERSRKRLIDATISYIETHNGFPTAAALAEHSGIAHRSIFRLFDSLDDIRSAVIADISKDAGALFLHGADDTTVPYSEARATYDAMVGAGLSTEFVTYDDTAHAVPGEHPDDVIAQSAAWLKTEMVDREAPCL